MKNLKVNFVIIIVSGIYYRFVCMWFVMRVYMMVEKLWEFWLVCFWINLNDGFRFFGSCIIYSRLYCFVFFSVYYKSISCSKSIIVEVLKSYFSCICCDVSLVILFYCCNLGEKIFFYCILVDCFFGVSMGCFDSY